LFFTLFAFGNILGPGIFTVRARIAGQIPAGAYHTGCFCRQAARIRIYPFGYLSGNFTAAILLTVVQASILPCAGRLAAIAPAVASAARAHRQANITSNT